MEQISWSRADDTTNGFLLVLALPDPRLFPFLVPNTAPRLVGREVMPAAKAMAGLERIMQETTTAASWLP